MEESQDWRILAKQLNQVALNQVFAKTSVDLSKFINQKNINLSGSMISDLYEYFMLVNVNQAYTNLTNQIEYSK